MPFNTETRTALRGLADGLLPLKEWIKAKSPNYEPPDASSLPWRDGKELTHERLQTIEYVEWLIASSDADDLLLSRWDKIRQEPLAYCPLPSPREFREGRGLSLAPRFATVEAGNSLADASGRQMSRRHLYDQCTPILVKTVKDAQRRLGSPDQKFWTILALDELHKGNCPEWRAQAGAPHSALLTEQFIRDVLTGLLNGWLDVEEPWRYALMIELGEFRRPGNEFKPANVDAATKALKEALERKKAAAGATDDTTEYATQWKAIP